MKSEIQHNFIGYFQFFYRVLRVRFLFDLFLSICVSFLDGIGLAMFIPLLQSMDTSGNASPGHSMGKLQFLINFFTSFHIPLNIYSVLVLLLVLFVFKGVLKFFQLNSQVALKQKFIKDIRYELTDDLQNLSYNGFLKQNAGKIQNIITAEVQKLQVALNHYLNSISAVAMLITYVIMAFLANWQFALLVAAGSMLTNLMFSRFVKAVKSASFKISTKGNAFNSHLIEAVHFFKYLKATNQFIGFTKKIKGVIDETEELNRQIGYYQAITASIREPMVMFIVVAVIIVQIRWLNGNLASVMLSLLLFYRALSFLMNYQNWWQSFLQNIGAIQSVSALSKDMKAEKEIFNDKVYKGFKSSIELNNLQFRYGENLVLNNVELSIPKNHTIALVGESGSGKTTLANIITGILPIAGGTFTIDGVPVTDYNTDTFRSTIGYISQEPVIFKDNVYNNVTFWAEPTEENMARFWEVIERASLTDFVRTLSEEEQTNIGDKGMLISGGQKQRISIARELYKNAEVLILDEATSALDSETELFIQNNIEKLQGNYTIIIIAHRLSTIKKADKIYMLEKGRVSYSGTFDELTEKSTRFKRMVSLQQI